MTRIQLSITIGLTKIFMGNVLSKTTNQYATDSQILNATSVNDYAYLSAGYDGLMVLDVKKNSTIKLDLGYVADTVVIGQTLLVLTDNGLKTVDISTPSTPTVQASADFISLPQGIVVKNKTAYIADWDKGLIVADISKPEKITEISTLAVTNAKTISLSPNGKIIAVVSDETDVLLFDISKPTPNKLGNLIGTNFKNTAFITDKTLAVAAGSEGVKLVDISKPATPSVISTIPSTDSANTLAVLNQQLFIADGENGLSVIDVSNPKKPVPVDNVANENATAVAVFIANSTAYLLNSFQNGQALQTFKVKDSGVLPTSVPDETGAKVDTGAKSNVTFSFTKKGDDSGNKLIGKGKNDSLSGLAGNDTLRGDAGHDYLDGGMGNDSIEGGTGNDTLLGGDGNDKLIAGSDNDYLEGGKDNDTLDGNAGNDTLNGGVGVDSMTGGDGNDYYVVENVKDKVVETSKNREIGGTDTIESTSETYTLGNNIEVLILKDVSGKGRTGIGNELDNTIQGSIGDDSLNGNAGNDVLMGDKGTDTLDGGLGMDTLIGGEGDDLYIMQNAQDKIEEKANQGIDHINAYVSYDLTQSANVEYLTLFGKMATEGTGNNLGNLLEEQEDGKVNNMFKGGKGNDIIYARGGNDTLEGGDGDDELNGGDGTDLALFAGIYEDYQITVNTDAQGTPQLKIEYVNSQNHPDILDGVDILNDVEILQFSDGSKYNKDAILKEISDTDSSAMLVLTGVENV